MTNQMLDHMANMEMKRHNWYVEAENNRHNLAVEKEATRTNKANEKIGRKNATSARRQSFSSKRDSITRQKQYELDKEKLSQQKKKDKWEHEDRRKATSATYLVGMDKNAATREKTASEYAVGMSKVNVDQQNANTNAKNANTKKVQVKNTFTLGERELRLTRELGLADVDVKRAANKVAEYDAKTRRRSQKAKAIEINMNGIFKMIAAKQKGWEDAVKALEVINKSGVSGLTESKDLLSRLARTGIVK